MIGEITVGRTRVSTLRTTTGLIGQTSTNHITPLFTVLEMVTVLVMIMSMIITQTGTMMITKTGTMMTKTGVTITDETKNEERSFWVSLNATELAMKSMTKDALVDGASIARKENLSEYTVTITGLIGMALLISIVWRKGDFRYIKEPQNRGPSTVTLMEDGNILIKVEMIGEILVFKTFTLVFWAPFSIVYSGFRKINPPYLGTTSFDSLNML